MKKALISALQTPVYLFKFSSTLLLRMSCRFVNYSTFYLKRYKTTGSGSGKRRGYISSFLGAVLLKRLTEDRECVTNTFMFFAYQKQNVYNLCTLEFFSVMFCCGLYSHTVSDMHQLQMRRKFHPKVHLSDGMPSLISSDI